MHNKNTLVCAGFYRVVSISMGEVCTLYVSIVSSCIGIYFGVSGCIGIKTYDTICVCINLFVLQMMKNNFTPLKIGVRLGANHL